MGCKIQGDEMNSISKKVLLGYLLVLVVAIIASVTLFGAASEVNKRTEQFVGETLPELNQLQQVKESLDAIQIAAYSLYGTMIDVSEFEQDISQHDKQFKQLLTPTGLLSKHTNFKTITAELKALQQVMSTLSDIMASDEVDWDGAREVLVEIDKHATSISSRLIKIKQAVSQNATQSSQIITKEIADIELLIIVLVISIVTVAVIAYLLSHKKIALPIRSLAEELDHVAQHYDLTVTVPQHAQDEVGVAGESINRLLHAFATGITDVRTIANDINGLVDVLGRSSENADEQVQLLNQKIDSLLDSMLTLEAQIETGFKQSQEASIKAKQGAKEVEHGAKQVADTSSGIASLAQDIESSAEMLVELRKSGDQVSTVVGTIAEIANQTNLLALNAAIEAARAGESGRGFAVVADEVRTLATRTHQSTIEINTMLEAIVASISQVVASMENNQLHANQAVELSQQTVEALSLIQTTILSLSDDSHEVAGQAEQSHHQVVDMRSWVEHFKTVGDAVSKGSMETRDTSMRMTELASSFNQSVARFRT